MMSNERQGQASTLVVVAKDNLKKRLSYICIYIFKYIQKLKDVYTHYIRSIYIETYYMGVTITDDYPTLS